MKVADLFLDSRFRERAPCGAPACLDEAQADEGEDAQAGEDQQPGKIAAGVLAALAHHVGKQEATEAAAASHKTGHEAEFLAEALRQKLKHGPIAHAKGAAGDKEGRDIED